MAINIAPKSLDTELSELMREVSSGKDNYLSFSVGGHGIMTESVALSQVYLRVILWERSCGLNMGMRMCVSNIALLRV